MNQKKRASSGSWERGTAWRLGASAQRTELAGVGVAGEVVLRRSSWSSLAIISGSEGSESLLEKWCAGENEIGDRRESIGEFRESLEKITEGFAESEEFRGVQRCLVCHVSSIREAQKQGQDTGVKTHHHLSILVYDCITFLFNHY